MTLIIENCVVQAGNRTILSVDKVSFPEKKTSVIVGPNGAGKSTLIRQVLSHKQITWRGMPVQTALKKGCFAWVGQHELFQLPMSLLQYALMSTYPKLAWYRRPNRADETQAEQLLAQFGLYELRHKRIETLSGGEQQRAAIVRALLQGAELLLMDEPTNHLDIRHQHHLMHHLSSLPVDERPTIVMVLHDLNLAAYYCDHVVLMAQGKVIEQGACAQVMDETVLSRIYDWSIEKRSEGDKVWFQARHWEDAQNPS